MIGSFFLKVLISMRNSRQHAKFLFLCMVFHMVLITRCGIPSLSTIPGTPSLNVIGIGEALLSIPENTDVSGGIVFLYKILLIDDPTDEAVDEESYSEYGALIDNLRNGNEIYETLQERGFHHLHRNSVFPPTIHFDDFPGLFDTATLANGLPADPARSRKITISLNANDDPVNMQILLQEDIGDVETIPLKRDSGISGNEDFSTYGSDDDDVDHLDDIENIKVENLRVSLAVFIFKKREKFDDINLYSLPYILSMDDLFVVSQL